jgi:hypothetical protein
VRYVIYIYIYVVSRLRVKIDLQELGWGNMEWIDQAQVRDR